MSLNDTNFFKELEENETFEKLGVLAGKIALNNFEWRFNTLVVFNLINLVAIEPFLKNYNAVILKKGKFIPTARINVHSDHTPQIVLFGQQSSELADLLQWLIENEYDNTARYIIVCVSSKQEECDEKDIVQMMGVVYVGNAIFLKLTQNETPEAYTIMPFRPNLCRVFDAVKLSVTFDCDGKECYKDLFPEKFENMHECPFTVSTFEQPPYMHLRNGTNGLEASGSDADILRLITQLLNATLVIKTPIGPRWSRYVNNNWTGSLGDVYNKRTVISMSNEPLTANKYGNFQISTAYDSMDLVWAARMPTLKPSWEKIFYPLPTFLRIVLFFNFFSIVCINTITKTDFWKKFTAVTNSSPPKSNLLFNSWIIFLGMPVVRLPSNNSFRMIVYAWMWYSLVIRSVYNATLISCLKYKAYENKLTSLSDVLEKKYPIGGFANIRDFYMEDPAVYDNWKVITQREIQDWLEKISKGETDLVLALNKQVIINFLVQKHGMRQIQILPEKIVNSPTVIYFRRNSHFCPPVNKMLTVAIEGGLSQRLYAQYNSYVKNLLRQRDDEEVEPLRMIHFTGSMSLLIVGWCLGAIFFTVEVVFGRK